jgi:hypothetical protein
VQLLCEWFELQLHFIKADDHRSLIVNMRPDAWHVSAPSSIPFLTEDAELQAQRFTDEYVAPWIVNFACPRFRQGLALS